MSRTNVSTSIKGIPALRLILVCLLTLAVSSWIACRKNDVHEHAGQAQDEAGHRAGATAQPADEQDEHDHLHIAEQEGEKIAWQKPELREPVRVIEMMGVIAADQDGSELITARIGGRIAAVNADVGQQLPKGAALFVLDSPELLALKETFIRSAHEYRLQQSAHERARILLAQNGIEAKTAQERQGQAAISRAQYLAARAALLRLGLDGRQIDEAAADDASTEKVSAFMTARLSVTSPLAGLVLERDLATGEWVSAAKPLFKVSDSRQLWGIFNATAVQYEGLSADLEPELSIQGLKGPMPKSRVLRIYPLVEESSRTVKVRLGIDNPDGRIRPGMFATVRLRGPAGAKRWLVGGESLTTINGVPGIFLHEGDGVRFLPLEQAERDGEGRLILPDSLAGKEIVTRGVFALKSATLLRSAGDDAHAGHSH